MHRTLNTVMAVMALFFLGACAMAPAKIDTPLPPPQANLLPAPESMPPPVPTSAEMQPPTRHMAETIATIEPEQEPGPKPEPVTSATTPEYISSFASYYAKRFEGRQTFSGERYDPTQMTAATRDFPLQSWLKVINPANGREVIVRINDRTGKRKTPLIDLSRAAAEELGFFGKGKIRVHVIPVIPTP